MKLDINKVVGQFKAAQSKFQTVIKDKTWLEEARKIAETQGKELKKLVATDVKKVKSVIEREKKNLEKLQTQLPGEIEKFKVFFGKQRRELEKMLRLTKRAAKDHKTKRKTKAARRTTNQT